MAETKISADILKMSFEDALAELQQIVGQLEQGQAKLEDAIGSYQRGAQLKLHCENKLREARQQIEKISLGPDGEPSAEGLDVD